MADKDQQQFVKQQAARAKAVAKIVHKAHEKLDKDTKAAEDKK